MSDETQPPKPEVETQAPPTVTPQSSPDVRTGEADARPPYPPRQADVSHPAQLGDYRIIRVLGEGGMGVVYEAEQQSPRRPVALKVIRPLFVSSAALKRFTLEAEVLGRLEHSGIARIYEAGTADSGHGLQPFFAMELVRGVALTAYALEKKLSTKLRLGLLARVCDAVQYAHQKGVVHRDLKPPNILVDEHGQPKILDFGVARATEADIQATMQSTESGSLVGTLPYMSPEQAAGDPRQLDTRSDVYALGVVAYELLSGRLPLELKQKALAEILRVIREDEPRRLSVIDKTYRGDIETIVGKALEKDKERRYASVAEMATDIRHHLDDEPIAARPPSKRYQLSKFAKRNKVLVGGLGAVFVVLVLGIIGTGRGLVRARLADSAAEGRRREADAARRTAQFSEAQALLEKQRAGDEKDKAELRLAHGLVLQGDTYAGALRWPEAFHAYLEAKLKYAELRASAFNVEVASCLARSASPPALLTFAGEAGAVDSVAISPNGRTALSGSADTALKLWDLHSGTEIRTFPGEFERSVAFSADGRMALVGSRYEETLKLIDLSAGTEIQRLRGPSGCVAVSPDGRSALSSVDKTLKLWDLQSGKEVRTLAGHSGPVNSVVFSSDGCTALSASADKTVKLWDLKSGEEVRTLATDAVSTVAFSSDGSTALSGSEWTKTLKLWDLKTGNEIRTFSGHTAGVGSVAITPNGRTALSASWDKTIKLWDLKTGEQLRDFSGHTGAVESVAISLDGSTALSGSTWDKTLKLWDLMTGKEIRTFSGHRGFSSVALSPDGRTALSGGSDRTITLWDLKTGMQILNLAQSQDVLSVAFSPDGRTAVSGIAGYYLKLWDLQNGREIRTFDQGRYNANVFNVAVAPDGRTALSVSGQNSERALKHWDLQTGKEIRTLALSASCVAFSPDGREALSGDGDNTLTLWNLQTGKEIHTFKGHADHILSVAFSPDGQTAISGSADKTLKIWDLQTGKEIHTLYGHTDIVRSVALSPDGRVALSGGDDSTLKLWDLQTGEEIRTVTRQTAGIISVAFSPDGRTALSGSSDATLKFWDFSRDPLYVDFEARVPQAQKALQQNRGDAAALAVLGNWYAFRGLNEWAVELLEKARASGAAVNPLALARCYWELSGAPPTASRLPAEKCLAAAAREYRSALAMAKDEQEKFYLGLCLAAVDRQTPDVASSATQPASGSRESIAELQPSPHATKDGRVPPDPDTDRVLAVKALAHLRDEGLPGLALAATDSSRNIRAAAVHAILEYSRKSDAITPALSAVLDATAESDEPIRTEALAILSELVDWESVLLANGLDESRPPRAPLAPNRRNLTGIWYENFRDSVAIMRLNDDGAYSMEINGKVSIVETGTWSLDGSTLISATKTGTDGRPRGTEDRVVVTRVEPELLIFKAKAEDGGQMTHRFKRVVPRDDVGPAKAFFSDDDGRTWFADDARKIPPFEHNGRTACRVQVYKSRTNGEIFVNHMERYTAESKAKMEALLAQHAERTRSLQSLYAARGIEVKKPKAKEWTALSEAATEQFEEIILPQGSDRSTDVRPVLPE